MRAYLLPLALLGVVQTSAAQAADEIFEFWVTPSVEAKLGRGRVELETSHRIRDGRDDTHFVRLWYSQSIAKGVTLYGGIEQRVTGQTGERRLHQQLSYKTGIFRGRTRLEQRFVEDNPLMGLRVRQRLGFSIPIGTSKRLAAVANVEGFMTLRATTATGQTGLTAVRTLIGVNYKVSDNLDVGLGYLRAQDIRRGAADRVGHAPALTLSFSL